MRPSAKKVARPITVTAFIVYLTIVIAIITSGKRITVTFSLFSNLQILYRWASLHPSTTLVCQVI
jgi:hypothetical protein